MKNKSLAGFSALKKQENGREVIEQILNMGQPRFAGALDFNGEDTAVEISDAISGSFNEGTISVWITKRSDGSDLRAVYNPAGTGADGLIIFSDTNSSQIRFQYGIGSAVETLNYTFTTKRWVHVAAVWGSFGGRLYIDGELKRTGDGVPDVDFSSTHNIGRQTTSRYHDGNICQLQLWNRALPGSEIRANMFRRLKGDEEGLVGYYPLDSSDGIDLEGLWRFDGDVLDSSGNENHGTIEGNPQFVQGVSGQALEFDGDNDYVQSSQGFNTDRFMTLMAWVRLDTTSNENVIISEDSTNQALMWQLDNGEVRMWANTREGSSEPDRITVQVDTSGLNHWALVYDYDTGEGILYKNGNVAGTDTQSIVDRFQSDFIRIGEGTHFSDRKLNGMIDEPRIYNRALTETEIALLYLNPAGISTEPVRDLTENQNHGSVVGDVNVAVPFNPLFTGDDRPELYQEKIAVEKEVGNLMDSHGNDPLSWDNFEGLEVIESDGLFIISETGESGSHLIRKSGRVSGGDGDYTFHLTFLPVSIPFIELNFTNSSGALKRGVRFNSEDSSVQLIGSVGLIYNYGLIQHPDGFVTIFLSTDNNVNYGSFEIRFRNENEESPYQGESGRHIIFKSAQIEEGFYPTLFTEGTRIPPKVLFPDTLPEQGHIHIKCDTINADQILFANESNALAIDDNYLSGKLLGNPFGSLPIGTDADLYDRIQFQVILTWDEEGGNVFFKVDGQVTQFPLSIQQIEDLDPNVFLGANADGEGQESCYFDILRTGEKRLTPTEANSIMEL